MELSVATDYARSTGDPSPYLRRIAEAGFSHIHWCHQWCTDFLYTEAELRQIEKWLSEFGLKLLDLHASAGSEKRWWSDIEYQRSAGVELVKNRIGMAARLGSDVIVMHVPEEPGNLAVRRSLDELQLFAQSVNVRIAIENTWNFPAVEALLAEYDPDYVGLCYDSGHGNINDELDRLDRLKDRVIAVHLHDNDGQDDLHQPPFMGTADWSRLASILAASSYGKPVSMELSMKNAGIEDEQAFLLHGRDMGEKLTSMIADVV